MSRGRVAAAVLCAAAALAGACAAPERGAPAPAGGRPRIAAEPPVFDFGSVLPGRTLHKDVAVRNHGDADLVLSRVDTTCNCTVIGGYQRTIPSGSGTTLRISLTTPEEPGRTEQAVRITSNDPDQPQLEVAVVATVVAAPKAR